jgi:hypothetical protein
MAENKQHEQEPVRFDPDLSNPANRHDTSEVNYPAVTKFGIALVLLCIFSFAILVGVFRFFQSQVASLQPRPAAPIDARRLPPEPRLQYTPTLDLQSMRAAEDEILNGYAWSDPDKGIVRIPVSQAMDLLAQRGLPSRPAAPAPAGNVTVPTESALGPKLQQPGGPLAGELTPSEVNRPTAQPSLPADHQKKH